MLALGWAGAATGPGNGETPGIAGGTSVVMGGLVVAGGELVVAFTGVTAGEPWAELTAPVPRKSTAVIAPTSITPSFLVFACFVIEFSLLGGGQ